MFNFIRNILSDRTFKVKTDDTLSDNNILENGTPQGSIISPTLFNIMIDDLFENIPDNIHTSQFADDGALWTSSNNINKATKTIQKALDTISKWTQQ